MNEIAIDIEGLKELQAAWARAPEICREELGAAMTEADALLEREIKELTPTGASGGGAGGLKGSILSREEIGESSVIGMVSASINYAVPVELGTRPHFPPIEPLIDWVRVKLAITEEKEARGVAFAIARSIARRGTLGVGMFHRGFKYNEAEIERIFQGARDRIVARLGGAA